MNQFRVSVLISSSLALWGLATHAQPRHDLSILSSDPAVARYKPDMSLYDEWSAEAQASEPCQYPFIGTYRDDSRSLRFIAAQHEVGANSSTIKLLKKSMSLEKPNLLILEGFSSDLGISPGGLKR